MALVLGVGLVGRLEVARRRRELVARVGGLPPREQRHQLALVGEIAVSGAAASSPTRSASRRAIRGPPAPPPCASCRPSGCDTARRSRVRRAVFPRWRSRGSSARRPACPRACRGGAARSPRDRHSRGWCSRGDRAARSAAPRAALQRASRASTGRRGPRRGRPRRVPAATDSSFRRVSSSANAQIVGDRDPLEARFAARDRAWLAGRRRGRARRRARAGPAARVALRHRRLRQHRDLAAGKVRPWTGARARPSRARGRCRRKA